MNDLNITTQRQIKSQIQKNIEVIQRIKDACQQSSDKGLAEFLNITPSVISAWKQSNKPPYHGCYLASQKTGKTIDWFLKGDEQLNMISFSQQQCCDAFTTVLNMAIELGIIFSHESPERFADKSKMLGEDLYQKLTKNR